MHFVIEIAPWRGDVSFMAGAPLARAWIGLVVVGATGVGVLSWPATGFPVLLVPMFLVGGVTTMVGVRLRSRRTISIGLLVTFLASWVRAVALWGLDQGGAGSKMLATFAWCWIAAAVLMLFMAVLRRGVA